MTQQNNKHRFYTMKLFSALALLWLILTATPCCAIETDWQGDSAVKVRLLSSVTGTRHLEKVTETTSPNQFHLGLEIDLSSGWHSYWRSVGDSGLPPTLDWKNSTSLAGNLKHADFLYPIPHRFMASGVESIGYKGKNLYPILTEIQSSEAPAHINLSLDLLICKELCVPKHFDFTLTIPDENAAPSRHAEAINKAIENLPTPATTAALHINKVTRTQEAITIEIAKGKETPAFPAPDLFVESEPPVPFLVTTALNDQKEKATFTLRPDPSARITADLTQLPLMVTVTNGGNESLEQKIPTHFTPLERPEGLYALIGTGLPLFLLLAFIGGVILNLMPCVLPVLSLKVLSVLKAHKESRARIRLSFLFSSAGILASFWLLAFMTIVLKQTGRAVGWGFHFQHPLFLVFLLMVLTLFAANLWGLFEISLPTFLAEKLGGKKKKESPHLSLSGDFATGALATLLATPCSAPFLGTAVGFALASGSFQIILIFTALGLGMALPYLAIAAWPRIATSLPKPGQWMTHIRKGLSLLLFITALWIVYILSAQTTLMPLLIIGLDIIILLTLLSARHKLNLHFSKTQIAIGLLFIAPILTISLTSTITDPKYQVSARQITKQKGWNDFEPEKIDALVKQGQTVVINLTADWCLTCKVNSRLAFQDNRVETQFFHTPRIHAMQGDWTNPSDTIHAFLKKHDRSGVPFTIVYGPNAPEGIILPELLTSGTLLKAIEKATDFSCRAETKEC